MDKSIGTVSPFLTHGVYKYISMDATRKTRLVETEIY